MRLWQSAWRFVDCGAGKVGPTADVALDANDHTRTHGHCVVAMPLPLDEGDAA